MNTLHIKICLIFSIIEICAFNIFYCIALRIAFEIVLLPKPFFP